ncbi:putative beta-lactamase transpeptidase-like protein [Rosellinia necatrix]|uniref:Putative beta-lactamase transpeptidase-like protein n=1 Tax=Rosellinia necatrix TaxID=77044 RepID=A0A1S7UTL9_ROSNE|nr:putative beta-lactamase transpeptidase-like protein [Rosellinia necatrix]
MPPGFFSLRRSYLTFSILAFIATLSLKPNTKLKYLGPFSSFKPTNMASQGDYEDIVARLESTTSVIEELRRITGNAGISLGVLHHGRVIYRANFGYRDMEAKIAPDSNTAFYLASMSKAMAANALTSLVKDGKVSFETKLADLVPEYRGASDILKCKELATEATLLDLMTHRLGITAGNNFWSQKGAKVLVDKSETARIVGFLQPVVPFRSSFMYSNWGYGLLGEIMESVSGEDLESLFQRTLFKPLGLERSSLEAIAGQWENVTKCYQALSDATPFEIPPTPYNEGSARAAAGAVKSTVNELLHLYGAWMAAANDQASTGHDETPGSPFKHVSAQWMPHNKITEESDYGLGWVLTNLPAKASITSLNPFEGPDVPVLAKGTAPRRLVYHHGSVIGGLSSVYLLPDTETAIVVLGNTFDLFDTPDFISQILLEALLDVPEPNEYAELGRRIAASTLSQLPVTAAKLAAEQVQGTSPSLPLEAYAGKYYNLAGNFFLDVSVLPRGEGLKMVPMSVEESAYDLRHYHYDVFFWPGADRDLQLKEALFPQPLPGFHKVEFRVDDQGNVASANWQIDRAIPDGETFYKK